MFTINAKNLDIQQIPGSAYSLVYQSSANKHIYQIDDAPIPTIERIQLFVKTIFQALASFICCRQYDDLKLQWKRAIHGKQILILEGSEILTRSNAKQQLTRSDLSTLVSNVKSKASQNDSTTTKLDYSGKQYEMIPTEIFKHSHLQELLLAMNNIKELPEQMSTMIQLKRLDLKVNRELADLPDWIGNLYHLESLELNACQLSSLPKSLYKLTKLKKLTLSGNRFTTIPKILFQLPSDCLVTLNHNPLSEKSIAALKEKIESKDYKGPKFIYPDAASQEIPLERPLDVVLGEWTDTKTAGELLKLSKHKQVRLINFLDRLKNISTFKDNSAEIISNVSKSLQWLIQENTGIYKKIAFSLIKTYAGDCDGPEKTYQALSLMQKFTSGPKLDLQGIKDYILFEACSRILHRFVSEKHSENVNVKQFFNAYWKALKKDIILPSYNFPQDITLELDSTNIKDAQTQLYQLIGTNDKQAQCLLKHPVWKALLEKQNGFLEIKTGCEQQKTEFLNAMTLEDQMGKNEHINLLLNTTWDPYYIMTLNLLKTA